MKFFHNNTSAQSTCSITKLEFHCYCCDDKSVQFDSIDTLELISFSTENSLLLLCNFFAMPSTRKQRKPEKSALDCLVTSTWQVVEIERRTQKGKKNPPLATPESTPRTQKNSCNRTPEEIKKLRRDNTPVLCHPAQK